MLFHGLSLKALGLTTGAFFFMGAAVPIRRHARGARCDAPGTGRAVDHLWDMSSAPGERVQVAKPRPVAFPRPAGRGAFMLDNVLPRVPVGKIGSGFHARVPL